MKLDPNKVYYLAHPLTTSGDMSKNYLNEIMWHGIINPDDEFGIVRPLACLPSVFTSDMDQVTAMQKRFALLGICDGIILCPGWRDSTGCREEYQYAKHAQIDIIEIDQLFEEEYEYLNEVEA